MHLAVEWDTLDVLGLVGSQGAAIVVQRNFGAPADEPVGDAAGEGPGKERVFTVFAPTTYDIGLIELEDAETGELIIVAARPGMGKSSLALNIAENIGVKGADETTGCIAPSTATAIDRSYPVARPLLMYTAGAPEGPVKEYLDWILSEEGQSIILEKGYAPVH